MIVGERKAGLAVDFDASKSMFGTEAGIVGKSVITVAAGASSQIPLCPNCNPKITRVYRDGLRVLADGRGVQRWLCMGCGLRFSEKVLKTNVDLASSRQICALGAKNLIATEIKTVAGDRKKPLKLDLLPEAKRAGRFWVCDCGYKEFC